MSASNEAFAVRHTEIGLKLVYLPHATKAPAHAGWQRAENLIDTAAKARLHARRRPTDGYGVHLGASGIVSLDPDSLEFAPRVLAAEGFDLEKEIATTPTITGRAPRLMYRVPEVASLRKMVLRWEAKADGEQPVTVFELRTGNCQDVLPPSIHPATQRPYVWTTPPRNGFPPLHPKLLEIWLDFDAFKKRHPAPWAQREARVAPSGARRPHVGASVITAFNDAHDPVALLESNGYERAGKRRWRSPHGKNLAGVVQLGNGKIFCHHASDPLGDEKPHDAFDLYTLFCHGGDVRQATRAAAELLGLRRASL